MHAKRQSSSETTHVVRQRSVTYVKSFLRAFTREKRDTTCFKFRFVSSPLIVRSKKSKQPPEDSRTQKLAKHHQMGASIRGNPTRRCLVLRNYQNLNNVVTISSSFYH